MMITINYILTEFKLLKSRIDEYYELIQNEVDSEASLDGLDSPSKTAEFDLWMWMFAAMSVIMDSLWNERKDEIQIIVDSAIPGTEKWFQKELLKFQYGDALSFDTDTAKYFYAVIDATKQIIKRCAVISSGGITQIKVAKEDGSGNPIALTAPELTAFISFVRQIQWAGANIANPVSFASDKLNAPFIVYYNGTIKIDDIKPLVEAAFTAYLAALPFNGEYKITAHQDALQAVANVNDVVPGVVQAKPDAGAYNIVNRVYYPVAGYIEKDGAIPLGVMITYVPQ